MSTVNKYVADNAGSQAWQIRASNAIRRLRGRTTTQKTVLFVLATYCNGKGQCWPSLERLMGDSALSSRGSIRRVLKQLENLGDIRRIRRRVPVGPEDGIQAGDLTNLYEVRMPASLVIVEEPPPRASMGSPDRGSLGGPVRGSYGAPNVSIGDLTDRFSSQLLSPPVPPQGGAAAAVSERVFQKAKELFPPSSGELTAKRVASGMRAVLAVQPPPTEDELVRFLEYQYRTRDVSGGRFHLRIVCDEAEFQTWRIRHGRHTPRAPTPRVVAGEPAVAKVPILDPKLAKLVQGAEAARRARGGG